MRDTWTRIVRRALRWTCPDCGHINPNITSTCRMCG
jgi:hypothetical protein